MFQKNSIILVCKMSFEDISVVFLAFIFLIGLWTLVQQIKVHKLNCTLKELFETLIQITIHSIAEHSFTVYSILNVFLKMQLLSLICFVCYRDILHLCAGNKLRLYTEWDRYLKFVRQLDNNIYTIIISRVSNRGYCAITGAISTPYSIISKYYKNASCSVHKTSFWLDRLYTWRGRGGDTNLSKNSSYIKLEIFNKACHRLSRQVYKQSTHGNP